jgi:hypothetical protein
MQGGEFNLLANFYLTRQATALLARCFEMRSFKQGTVATQLIPSPNLFELADTWNLHQSEASTHS